MKDIFYFGRRSDNDQRGTPPESKFRSFFVSCQKCHSYLVRLQVQYDDAGGEYVLVVVCTRCRQQETIRV